MVCTVDALTTGSAPIDINVPTNWIITTTLSGSTYTNRLWKNGVSVLSATSTSPMVVPSGVAAANIGNVPSIFGGGGDDFVFYRCHADSLASRTAAQFVAAEYAAGVGRFS
jgi:hypothetical protein